jgi:predicted O-linked N-acetylglucosamine transferase (SPINDLY family)
VLRKLLARLGSTGAAPGETDLETADRLIAEGRRAEDAGKLHDACERYRAAVAAAPRYPAAHLNLGVGLEAAGDADGAAAAYRSVLDLDPGNAYASYNLGKLHFLRQDLHQAERDLRAALERKPEFPEARILLGGVLEARGDLAGAASEFDLALRARTEDFGAWLRYGFVLLKLERENDAESAFTRAATLDPTGAEAHRALADLYQSRGDFSAAASYLEVALQRRPEWPEGLFSYAHVLMRIHRFDDAADVLTRLLALEPDRDQVHLARMDVLARGGRLAQMLELCRARRALAPERADYASTELFTLNFVDEISAEDLFARHKAFGQQLERAVPERFARFANSRDPGRRLRIGYLSGEFYLHPVARFMIPLIEHHDRSAFEAYCYSTGALADSFTRQLESASDVWREVKSLEHAELADLIHADRIDVLVDLSGHSGNSKLAVFAQHPAPVQATWLGNLNTTGLTRIQYRITDGNCDPPGLTEHLHTEELVRLPHSQWCYRPYVAVDVPDRAPVERSGHVTFGSFTQFPKLTARMRTLWARILRELPGARLVMAGVPLGAIRDELLEAFARDGVDSSRITLLPFMSLFDYMRAFQDVDITLDTSPYSGGTTTCDGLWMGVPVVTMPGARPSSRSASGILAAMGLSAWIAQSPEDYVRRAVEFGRQPETIAELRRTLRERMLESPLMQEKAFALDVEQAWRSLWRRWCSTL